MCAGWTGKLGFAFSNCFHYLTEMPKGEELVIHHHLITLTIARLRLRRSS